MMNVALSSRTMAPALGRWARLLPAPDARLRLLCFPYAGRGASAFNSWKTRLPASIEVVPLQLPGRETRISEQPFLDMGAAVSAIADLEELFEPLPFAFYGHSMGATLAFQLTRELRRRGRRLPVALCVGGRLAPHLPNPRRVMHKLETGPFIEALRSFSGTPEEVLRNADLMDLLLPCIRADFQIAETYRPQAEVPLPCPIQAYCGDEDPEASVHEMREWGVHTKAGFDMTVIKGGHFFLHSAEEELLGILGDFLGHLSC